MDFIYCEKCIKAIEGKWGKQKTTKFIFKSSDDAFENKIHKCCFCDEKLNLEEEVYLME